MPETRRKFDPEFREGAVRIVEETAKSITHRSLGTWASTRARSVTGSPVTAPDATARRPSSTMTQPSSSACGPRTPSCGWSATF